VADNAPLASSWLGTSADKQASFDAAALQKLRNATAQAFHVPLANLSAAPQLKVRDDQTKQVEIQQLHGGLAIRNAGILLEFNSTGVLTYFRQSFVQVAPELRKPSLPSDLHAFVREHAVSEIPDGATSDIGEISPLFLMADDGNAVWAIEASVKTTRQGESVPGRLDIVIAVPLGKVLEVTEYDLPQQTYKANVFWPTPMIDCTTEYPTVFASPQYVDVDLRRLAANAKRAEGSYAKFFDLDHSGEQAWDACSTGTCEFHFTWPAGGRYFAEVMIYYVIDRIQDYVQGLGFSLADRQIQVDAIASLPSVYAKYENNKTGTGNLYFGFGPNGLSVGADGKVIAHEYAHALQCAETKMQLSKKGQPRGIEEGFADYFAISTFAIDEKPTCRTCIGVFMNSGACFRSLAQATPFDPAHIPTDAYTLGLKWANALWTAVSDIETSGKSLDDARRIVDRGVLLSHQRVGTIPQPPTMPTFAFATVSAFRDDSGTASYADALCAAFEKQGILEHVQCVDVKTLPIAIQ